MPDIWIMRIGHRPERDKRVTTHVALSSRALGARGIYVDTHDEVLEENIRSVAERFGGDYQIKTGVRWQDAIRGFDGKVIHLTMYGERVDEALPKIPRDENLMIVVGAEKVPREVYDRADFNISVGNQPHSEIAALAIFLDRLTEGKALYSDRHGKITVVPNERGKTVVENSDRFRMHEVSHRERMQEARDHPLLHCQGGGGGDGIPHPGGRQGSGHSGRASA
ncbi:MAG: tRNA (cytidine(56)-2'-O)-methyltransferase [Candidatus Methanomethylophilaceae archaeon]|jgi:tRNA (cytidine56-2'-O)-methyltransferase|nr:tRNA (cytidine(56)-2'-O)-methyltransferase [Candidatus Methanomethylophilaceae archaeon]